MAEVLGLTEKSVRRIWLFAALNNFDGTVISMCDGRHVIRSG
jgi:hypothetical protein